MTTDRGAWFRWKKLHPVEASDPEAAFAAGMRRGGAAQLHLDSQLARELGQVHALLERTERLINQLAEREPDIEHEIEDAAAYWHTEHDV